MRFVRLAVPLTLLGLVAACSHPPAARADGRRGEDALPTGSGPATRSIPPAVEDEGTQARVQQHLRYAEAKVGTGDLATARLYLLLAKELAPEHEEVRRALASLSVALGDGDGAQAARLERWLRKPEVRELLEGGAGRPAARLPPRETSPAEPRGRLRIQIVCDAPGTWRTLYPDAASDDILAKARRLEGRSLHWVIGARQLRTAQELRNELVRIRALPDAEVADPRTGEPTVLTVQIEPGPDVTYGEVALTVEAAQTAGFGDIRFTRRAESRAAGAASRPR